MLPDVLCVSGQQTLFNECWGEVLNQDDCPVRPWTFEGPGWALMIAIFQVGMSNMYKEFFFPPGTCQECRQLEFVNALVLSYDRYQEVAL